MNSKSVFLRPFLIFCCILTSARQMTFELGGFDLCPMNYVMKEISIQHLLQCSTVCSKMNNCDGFCYGMEEHLCRLFDIPKNVSFLYANYTYGFNVYNTYEYQHFYVERGNESVVHGKKFYWGYDERVQLAYATEQCQMEEAFLAMPMNEEENLALTNSRKTFEKKRVWLNAEFYVDEDIWIHRRTGLALDFSNFNESVEVDQHLKTCVILGPKGEWIKAKCNANFAYACEKEN